MLTATGLTAWTKVLGPNSAPFPDDSPAIFTVSAAFLVRFAVSILDDPP
jgi:cation/acetate symporter